MHWDPGPYWDWQYYFLLMGAPLQAHAVASSDVVRILPGFDGELRFILHSRRSYELNCALANGLHFSYQEPR